MPGQRASNKPLVSTVPFDKAFLAPLICQVFGGLTFSPCVIVLFFISPSAVSTLRIAETMSLNSFWL